MNRLVFVFLAACGGTVSTGDDAAVTPDAALDSPLVTEASTEASADASITSDGAVQRCLANDAGFACAPLQLWTWGGDSGTERTCDYDGASCASGELCTLVDGTQGVCE